ncbi:unnamed protein product, partial [Mesorhabditis spiculigera]
MFYLITRCPLLKLCLVLVLLRMAELRKAHKTTLTPSETTLTTTHAPLDYGTEDSNSYGQVPDDSQYYSAPSYPYDYAGYSGYYYVSEDGESAVDARRQCDVDITIDDEERVRIQQMPEFEAGYDDQIDPRITGNCLLAGLVGVAMNMVSGYLYVKRSPLRGNVALAFGAILAFFGGNVYRLAKYLMIMYMIIVCVIPIVITELMIGIINDMGTHCWGGFWYDPTNFAITINFYKNAYTRELFEQLSTVVLGIITGTLGLNLTTFWRLKYLGMLEKGNLVASHNQILMILLGFSNLSYFFDEFLAGLTQEQLTFGRNNVSANIAKTYRYHASIIVTGMLFVCYCLTCGNRRKEKNRGMVTVTAGENASGAGD